MEVILRQDVDKLGRRGDVVKVAEGFGRNYLLPRGLALQVNEANKAMIAKERKAHELRLAKEKSEFQAVADRIASLRYIAPRKVGENDALYGSVTSGDIADFLRGKGVDVLTWTDWEVLDAHERSLGEPHGRARVKVVSREDMIKHSRGSV